MHALLALLLIGSAATAQDNTDRPRMKRADPNARPMMPHSSPLDRDMSDALNKAKSGNYAEASQRLFQLSYSPRFAEKRMQLKYIMGMTLMQMHLNQVAAFQFIGVIKEGHNQFVKPALQKL